TSSRSPARKPTEGRVSTCVAEVMVRAIGAPPVELPALITMTMSGLVPPPSITATGRRFRFPGRAAKGAGQAEPLGSNVLPPCHASRRQPQTFIPWARPLPASRSSRIRRQPVIVPTCWASAWPVVARRPISLAEKAWTIARAASSPTAMPTSSSTMESPLCRSMSSSVVKGADGDVLAGLRHRADRPGAVAHPMTRGHPGHDDPHREGVATDGGAVDGGVARRPPAAFGLDTLREPFLEERAAGGEVGDDGGGRGDLHASEQFVGRRGRLGPVAGIGGHLGARGLRADHAEHGDREHDDRDQALEERETALLRKGGADRS